jgi:hypothetical protein
MALVVLLVLSCHLDRPAVVEVAWKEPGISDSLSPLIRGIYNGHFKEGLMTLVINYISDSNISGYDIRKGLRRNVNGTVKQNGAVFDFVLKEPGNNPLDGTFFISMNTASQSIIGKWVPRDSAKTHSGPLDLKKWEEDNGVYVDGERWSGDRGELYFHKNGTCELTDGDVTIWGIYDQNAEAFFIEWEPNDDLPVRKMKLVKQAPTGDWQGPTLQGDGVKFGQSTAG